METLTFEQRSEGGEEGSRMDAQGRVFQTEEQLVQRLKCESVPNMFS